jgi:pimeloyl-ACP methyl ester carboxylesterase
MTTTPTMSELRRQSTERMRPSVRSARRRDTWHVVQSGSGRPLVLLHGIGMSSVVWTPVMPYLAPTRRVLAFDIAGFGKTPPLLHRIPPTVPHLVDALVYSLRDLDVELPVDIAGNSLGGWMALEAARRGVARTALAISPAGLWERRPPWHVSRLFRLLRIGATRFPKFLEAIVRRPALRELALTVPISPGTRRMPVGEAVQIIRDLAGSRAFETTLEHTRSPLSARDIRVPVTVAFGDRDRIITRSARGRDALPAHTRWLEPRGWGHVPMWTDPAGVAALILESAS